MFQLTAEEESARLRFQIEISKIGRGGRRYRRYAFTEQGVAMLSSVLNSDRAVAVNILIMRTFVQLRRTLSETAELGHRVDGLERQVGVHGAVLADVLKALRALERPTPQKRREIGFQPKI
ncbi:MAG TPA: ORF6N domain-containing protein [Candidatus Limnocylindria bacterium]|nr:ORF6N domain-containing protein [Candidatus Limnocylindria bacterium]